MTDPTISVKIARNISPDVGKHLQFKAAHKINGANEIIEQYRADGSLIASQYKNNGKFSRTDGPAILEKNANGEVTKRIFYVDGLERTTRAEYESAGGTGWMD